MSIDRSKCCHRCGDEGHNRVNCAAQEFCSVCNKTKHTLGSRLCKAFKEAFKLERNKNKVTNKVRGMQTKRTFFVTEEPIIA